MLTFVNVLFRSVEAMSSCPLGRSTVVTLRCNPEKSTGGDLSVPRYHSPGLTRAFLHICLFSRAAHSWTAVLSGCSLGDVSKEKQRQTLFPFFCSFPFFQSSTCPLAALHISRDGCMLRLRGSYKDQRVAFKPGYMINMQDRVLAPAVNLLFHPAVWHCAWHLQPLSCRNVRWLHLLLFMGELGSLSYMHGDGLPSDRGSLQRRTAGMWTWRYSIISRWSTVAFTHLRPIDWN